MLETLSRLIQDTVSRETFEKLEVYRAEILRWNPVIKGVSRHDLDDLWQRHIFNCAAGWPVLKDEPKIVDLGTGAGFPGLVLAILGHPNVDLVESNKKKCQFLQLMIKKLKAPATLVNENFWSLAYDRKIAVTARAVTDLRDLLKIANTICKSEFVCYFYKGLHIEDEISQASQDWHFTTSIMKNPSCQGSVILKMSKIQKK